MSGIFHVMNQGRSLLRGSVLLTMSLMMLSSMPSTLQAQACFCGENTAPNPNGSVTITYTSQFMNSEGECESEGTLTIPLCWPSGQWVGGDVELTTTGPCPPMLTDPPETIGIEFRLTEVGGEPVWELKINGGSVIALDGDCASTGATSCTSSCTTGTYTIDNSEGNTTEFTEYKVEASGECIEIQEGQTDVCLAEKSGSGGDNGCVGDESDDPVSYLTGHKAERNADLVVKLPGRDFQLIREYTSNPGFYVEASPGHYYWNGDIGTTAPGFIGVNWTANVFSMMIGDVGDNTQNMYISGVGMWSVERFTRASDPTDPIVFHAVSGKNKTIIEAQTFVKRLGLVDVWRVIEPGGVEKDYARRPYSAPGAGFDKSDIVGRLVRQRDDQGNVWYYEWFGLLQGGYGDTPRLRSIYLGGVFNSGTDDIDSEHARVDFLWHGQFGTAYDTTYDNTTNGNSDYFGRLAEVQVHRDVDTTDLLTQKVKYTYLDEWIGNDDIAAGPYTLDELYDASPGDLCQVVVSELIDTDLNSNSSNDDFYDRVYQYRYHGGDFGSGITAGLPNNPSFGLTLGGTDHQLLAVFYPEQVEYFADHYNKLALTSGTVLEAADLLRWIRFDEDFTASDSYLDDPVAIFEPGTYWNSLYPLASKLIGYYGFSENSQWRVQTQIVNAGGSSGCGCGGSAGGSQLGKRYDYMYKRYTWSSLVGSPPSWILEDFDMNGANGYSCQIVESNMVMNGSMVLEYQAYRVYSHDYYWPSADIREGDVNVPMGTLDLGVGIFKVMSVISEANHNWDYHYTTTSRESVRYAYLLGGKSWVTYNQYNFNTNPVSEPYNDYGKITKQVTTSAINRDDEEGAVYLPAYRSGTSTISPTKPAFLNAQGLINTYTYEDGWLNKIYVQKGEGGTPINVTEIANVPSSLGREDLREHVKRFAGGGVVEETEVAYEYHSLPFDTQVISAVRVKNIRETEIQNGPITPVDPEEWQLFNTKGQVVWEMDADKTLTYSKYDSETGELVKRVHDAKATGSYVDDPIGGFPGAFTAPTVRGDESELIDLYEVDLLGRVVKHTDPSGVKSYYRYEYLPTDMPDSTPGASTDELVDRGVPYYAQTRFPHEFEADKYDGPITRTWMDTAGNSVRTSSFIATDGGGTYNPLIEQFDLGDEVERSDTVMLINSLPIQKYSWHTLNTILVSSGADKTTYEYDALGRISKMTDPEQGVIKYGDAMEIGYDILDRPLSVFQGTTTGTLLVSKNYYDSPQDATQGVGNGVLTYTEVFDGEGAGNGNTRATKMWYDFRDRLIGQENPQAPHSVYAYDDLNRVTQQASFTDTTGFTTGITDMEQDDQVKDPASFDSNQSTYRKIFYNNRGMQYRTQIAIDPTDSGTTYLESNIWYDVDGSVIASWSPNSAATKYEYDALDRPKVVYATDHFGDALPGTALNHPHASSVTDDHVISQVEYTYVAAGLPGAGSVQLTTQRMRRHDAGEETVSGVTDVVGALTTSNSVATYSAYVFDDASRIVHSLQYGTNDADGFISATSAPTTPYNTNRSTSAALISSVGFDSWGRINESIDPAGKSSLTKFDDLSRTVAMIESASGNLDPEEDIEWNSMTSAWDVTWPMSAPVDEDRVTSFVYDGNSNMIKRTAHLNDGSVQVTAYDYGTTEGSYSTVLDSLIHSSSLLHKVHYPNESTGAADTSAAYTVTYAYNRLGELRGTSDQNGTVHVMTRDSLGRITADTAATLGTNIDGAVKSITEAFDGHGRISSVDSLNSSSVVINSVDFEYTPLHQIATVIQNVDANGSGTNERVEYDYSNAVPSTSGGNYSRVSGIRYPSQAEVGTSDTLNTISFDYTGTSGFDVINDRISRVADMGAPSWGSSGVTSLVHYDYLGRSTSIKVNYPSIGKGLDYTKDFGGDSTAGEYPGFDQYGRVVWHAWVDDGFTTGPNSGFPNATPLIARRYGYDQMSNRTFDFDGRPGATPVDRDWEYEYDNLDRLETATRGSRDQFAAPSALGSIAANSRMWNLDMLGNWNNVITDEDGDELFEAGAETELRTFNSANEMISREGPSGTSITFAPTYDDAGNFASNGSTGAAELIYTHDAWNRLVKVEREIMGGAVLSVLENTYNGLNWRIIRKADLSKGAYNGLDEKRTYYYSAGWQMIEEHVDEDVDVNSDSTGGTDDDIDYASQQVWGARYIDDAVAKRIDRDGDGDWDDSNSEYYYLTDVMFSVRALVDSAGRVQERIDYTPYGVATHRFGADFNEDGLINSYDTSILGANTGGSGLSPGDSGYDPDVDADGNGTMNFFDISSFLAIYGAQGANSVPDGWITDPTDSTWTDNTIGYDGYHFDYAGATDATTGGVYCVRHRTYDPGMGRWLEKDPIRYAAMTMNLYENVYSNPIQFLDPLGLFGGVHAPRLSQKDSDKLDNALKSLCKKFSAHQENLQKFMESQSQCVRDRLRSSEDFAEFSDYVDEFNSLCKREDLWIHVSPRDLGANKKSKNPGDRPTTSKPFMEIHVDGKEEVMTFMNALNDEPRNGPVIYVNTNPKHNWSNNSQNSIEKFLLHELTHYIEWPAEDQDHTGRLTDPHEFEKLSITNNIEDYPPLNDMIKKAKKCCGE